MECIECHIPNVTETERNKRKKTRQTVNIQQHNLVYSIIVDDDDTIVEYIYLKLHIIIFIKFSFFSTQYHHHHQSVTLFLFSFKKKKKKEIITYLRIHLLVQLSIVRWMFCHTNHIPLTHQA